MERSSFPNAIVYYETNTYKIAPCTFLFLENHEPTDVSGKMFMYAGDGFGASMKLV